MMTWAPGKPDSVQATCKYESQQKPLYYYYTTAVNGRVAAKST